MIHLAEGLTRCKAIIFVPGSRHLQPMLPPASNKCNSVTSSSNINVDRVTDEDDDDDDDDVVNDEFPPL